MTKTKKHNIWIKYDGERHTIVSQLDYDETAKELVSVGLGLLGIKDNPIPNLVFDEHKKVSVKKKK